ncbi:VPLPA-CTERM sorting domain-containing protein [Marinobacterium mangrovicola]|uniref:Putative secreted protein n=1 Tax=Marinobacterium mangrovicola TaxID=1476959 RepID=A0A4R1GCD1_9GAMM|nr:VPLPA-CTERM sorting domain-containing protein [Marinobacterium mangrovicola]TCK04225.1 putative secreted protein [Marinobacterium mangrovicola]
MKALKAILMTVSLVFVSSYTSAGTVTVFEQDFESSLGANESLTGDAWILTTSYDYGTGSRMLGDPLGSYSNNENVTYQISGLDFSDLESAVLSFDLYGRSEYGFDWLWMYANGSQFAAHTGFRAGTLTYDLSAFAGLSNVDLRWWWISDLSIARQGYTLDNISVSGISAVPVPAAAWLFGTALLGFAGTRLRRRKSITV